MQSENIPGGYDEETSRFELDYWENFGGAVVYDLHFAAYSNYFPLLKLDFDREHILDIGSGPCRCLRKQHRLTPG